MKLMIVGNVGGTNVGGSLLRAAQELGLEVCLVESRRAMEAPIWLRRFNWWLRGRRPTWLRRFSKELINKASSFRPTWLLTTGIAPCNRRSLQLIGSLGIKRLNYLTDDPFNPLHRASWFIQALPLYDHVFTPRRAVIEDLLVLGCRQISYLPFAYDPELCYPDIPSSSEEQCKFTCDVMFAGGADRDRVPYIIALIREGFNVHVYGDYWQRYTEIKPYARGHADPQTLRKATSCAKVALCLVRRGNRDGHVMRSFEIPAIGACMLTEDTEEHREIFGEEGRAVMYFRTIPEMIEKLRWLLDHDDERRRLAAAAHAIIVSGCHAYRDRLITMLDLSHSKASTF